jgi:hypothetical protein
MPHHEFFCLGCKKTFDKILALIDHEEGDVVCPHHNVHIGLRQRILTMGLAAALLGIAVFVAAEPAEICPSPAPKDWLASVGEIHIGSLEQQRLIRPTKRLAQFGQ